MHMTYVFTCVFYIFVTANSISIQDGFDKNGKRKNLTSERRAEFCRKVIQENFKSPQFFYYHYLDEMPTFNPHCLLLR